MYEGQNEERDEIRDETAAEENGDFASMLAESEKGETSEPKAGDQVTGKLIQIGDVDSFVDCGARSELPIATAELKDETGALKYEVGDEITAHVQGQGSDLRLTFAMDVRHGGLETLQQAYEDRTPLKGTVRETNKGGFAIDLGGRRAFCPYSQIDLYRVDNPEGFVGRELEFLIIELSPDGKNIVLSRRQLLEKRRDVEAAETRETLALGDEREGTVTRLVPFGAFVDIGGVEGLVHISQLAHARVDDPGQVLRTGESVQVKVIEIQNLGQGRRERIGLSIKALQPDPWPLVAGKLEIGGEVEVRVTRLADFGAFCEIEPGVEGLIHISELANRRLFHPREVVAVDDHVSCKVLSVDLDRRRISLSLRQSATYTGE
jgi:small subunit ribosomal protein S1